MPMPPHPSPTDERLCDSISRRMRRRHMVQQMAGKLLTGNGITRCECGKWPDRASALEQTG
ncbi:hypothetical protein [Synechococcus sp. 1G10]|uniref:hypothetical protein n=1 Tax=Synechococcus sp. 1G10 TaxID=2025605 RepID=UPI001E50BEFF|nr:hypothetical protein [Synechococcus sp. 1G10]